MSRPLPTKERRNHQREKSSIGASVNDFRSSYFTHLRDISRGGAFIHSYIDTNHHIGQNVIVTLPAKRNEKLKLVSKIVWIDKDGIGVKFLRYHSRPE